DCFADKYSECFLCGVGAKRTKRTWALAVLREEVREGGKVIGYRDVKREVTFAATNADGTEGETSTTIEPAIVAINLAGGNFFGPVEAVTSYYGTALDRDFVIKRKGDGLDTH